MTPLSENDREVITRYPLGSSIDHLRESLRIVERAYTAVSPLDGADDSSGQDSKKAVSRLLSALIGTEAAFALRSNNAGVDVITTLATTIKHLQQSDFSYSHYQPLVKLVLEGAPDFDIWSTVLALISKFSRVTPPASVPPAFDSTPITHTSASQQGDEQTRRLVEARVFEEIRGCTFRNVNGFFEKYFEGKHWTDGASGVFESIKSQHVDGKWLALPNSPTQDDIQDWLFQLQDDCLTKERRRYFTINAPSELTGAETQRQIDLIIKRSTGEPELSDARHDWRDIEVIGELKESSNGVKRTLVQIARYVRDVLTCQPTRRYVHAFTICGREMELWVFDRSGCYSSGPFDIHDEPRKFVQVMAGYIMMGEDELGLDTFREQDGDCTFIYVKQEAPESMKKLQLKSDPLTCQRSIVSRGTSCYLTKASGAEDWTLVTKLSWTSDRRKPEVDHLKLADQRGVEGIARLICHQSIASIKEMRSDLVFEKPYSFRGASGAASSFSQSGSQSRAPSVTSRSFSELHGLTISESTGERPSRKRKSVGVGPKPSKRSKSSSQRSSPLPNQLAYDVEEAQGASLLTPTGDQYDNRILRCLVLFPAGRPIYKYESPLQLMEALRDAIKAHRSLYTKGNILHRDISENNIIITDPTTTGHAGMLIDLDLAKEVGSGRSGARCRTGTMEFMAIEVLLNIDHTYRHDLESFFYVLIWQCTLRGWEFVSNPGSQPKPSLLTRWYMGSYEEIATAKGGVVGAKSFELILAKEFPPQFECIKPLCRELRGILFPIREGDIFTGTPKDPEIFYGPIIKAFDKAIEDIKEGE
ncbi:hypothetical protein AJ80_02316 [Polytolypa hystricis UAMH7299]|uniref:EKC/KEOPS complex subunit BUD32 n=1 Tax=Polytolypa hystricis (strain UAMH7299) TaxID=1447883 RepID=A0A2B7YRA5_POLH7|nr:hypothetical protein AJ80_02316 [Polytolypa hystricis UAMH7299]